MLAISGPARDIELPPGPPGPTMSPEQPYGTIVSLLQHVLNVPICIIAIVDQHLPWLKAASGLTIAEAAPALAFCTHTIAQPGLLIIPDLREDARFAGNALVTGRAAIRSHAGLPLRTQDGRTVGSLSVIDTAPREFSVTELTALRMAADLVLGEIALRQVAATDYLSGAMTRRAWMERAEEEVARARRYGRKLALAMLDIDCFKVVNDTYGHEAGDRVIRRLSEICLLACRSSDLFGRLGGEEFALLAPEANTAQILRAAERIRTVFGATLPDAAVPITCTVSIGIATLREGDRGLAHLLERADKTLYDAKHAGRNRTCIYLPPLRRQEDAMLKGYSTV